MSLKWHGLLAMVTPRMSSLRTSVIWILGCNASSKCSRIICDRRVLGSNKNRVIHRGMRIKFSHHDALMACFSTDLREDLREDFTEVWQGFGPKYSSSNFIKGLIKAHQKFEDPLGFPNLFEVGIVFWAFPLMRFKKIQLLPVSS